MESLGAARVQRAELLAALSLAIDLGLGLPLEHMLRSCSIAMRLADLVGASDEDREVAYYGGLLCWIGCHADSEEFAELLGDDVAFRADSYGVDWRGPAFAALLIRHVGTERSAPRHAVRLAAFLTHARDELLGLISSHCISAGRLADGLGLRDPVRRGLACTFERWDGSGMPDGIAGDRIPLGMRLVHVADVVEVHLARGGPAAASAVATSRSGTQLDPELVQVLCDHLDEIAPPGGDVWDAVIDLAPDAGRLLTEQELMDLLTVVGDFVDLKCPWTVGHSRAVASLASTAGAALDLDRETCTALERSGHLLDLGRMGVPNRVWRMAVPSTAQQERIRLHPYLSRRIVSRVPGLRPLGGLVGAHHERLDGSGYPHGLSGAELALPARVLGAADAYRSLLEPDPLTGAVDPDRAAALLRSQARAGRMDAPAVEAVLAAAGRPRVKVPWPAGLTDREVTVLRLLAQGRTAAQVAAALHISPKTARNHADHIAAKVGAANRTGVALFALQHGLVDRIEPGSADRR